MGKLEILSRDDSLNIAVCPGDTFELSYVDPSGNETVVLTEKIEEIAIIDSVVAFKFKGILGMKRGIGGAFGEKE